MNFEGLTILYLTTGIAFTLVSHKVRQPSLTLALVLSTLLILWGVSAIKFWVPTFPVEFQWIKILLAIAAVVGSMRWLVAIPTGIKKEEK